MAHNPESGGGTFIPKGEDVDFALHAWAPVQFLEIDPALVTLQPGEHVSITLTLDATNILPGQFSDTITLTDTTDESTRQIPVLLTVAEDVPPAAPGALSATRISDTRIDLAWTDRSDDETGFRVERSLLPDTGFDTVATLSADSESYTDDTVVAANTTRYYYRVWATNEHGKAVSGVVAAGNEPVAPTDVQATVLFAYDVEITWNHAGPETDRFFIERRLADTEDWFVLAVVPLEDKAYLDTVEAFAQYDYRVTAFDADCVGSPSLPVTVVVEDAPWLPAAPTDLEVITLSATDLRVTWEPPDNAEHQFIERSVNGPAGPWTLLLSLMPDVSAYTDTGLDPDTTYHYRVWASNIVGHGERSTAQGTTDLTGDLMLIMPDTIEETAGHFMASVHRTGTSGHQVIRLTASNDRLSVPRYIVIPDGQSSVEFTVTVHDDEIINTEDSTSITAYAPTALMGESFSGPEDNDLTGQDTGWGWGGAWYHNNTSPQLKEPALTYSQNGTIGTPGTRFARLMESSSLGEGRRNFPGKLSTGSVWVSTLIYRNHTDFGVQLLLRENTGPGDWARVRYFNGWQLESSGDLTTTLLASHSTPTTLFLVMQFDFDERKVHAWFNPDVNAAAPTNWLATATLDMRDQLSGISRLDIAGRSTTDGFDEIRVATSFGGLYGGDSTTRAIRILDDEAPPAFTAAEWWRLVHFRTTALEGEAAWGADPDGDGVPNLLEYALGGDPHQPHTAPRAQPGWIEIGDETYWTVRIDRNPDADDIVFLIETSIDLNDWLYGSAHIVVLEDEPEYIRVRGTAPLSSDTLRFIRYGVVTP